MNNYLISTGDINKDETFFVSEKEYCMVKDILGGTCNCFSKVCAVGPPAFS